MAFIVIITTIPNEIPFFSLYIGCAQSASVCVQSRIYQFPGFISFYRILFRERENGPTFQIRNQKIKRKINSLKMWTLERLAPSHTIEFQNKKWGKKRSREREKIWKSIGCKLAWPRAKRREKKEREIQNCGYKKPEKRARASTPIPIWSHTTARPHHFHSKQDQYKYCNETQPSPAVCISFFFLRAVGAESRATLKRRCSPAGWKRNGATASFSFLGTERNFLGTARGLELCYLLFIPFNKNR